MLLNRISIIFLAFVLAGCGASAQYHKQQVQDDKGDRLTVGTVQKEIRVGMPSADVAQALGSPNIVSTDEERREVWIYDKIASDTVYSVSPGAWLIGGGTGAVSGTQRTLTIIIKYDAEGKVRDFAYHTSKF